jgi:putative hydrolase of the HAD superfamily
MFRHFFTDIGNVLLTNGWDRGARQRLCEKFNLDPADVESRHHLTFDTYEIGKLSLDDYLKRIVFFAPRPYANEEVREFVFAQSQPLPGMLELLQEVKSRNPLRVIAISNEGRELTDYRVKQFSLASVIDFFVSSCYVHLRKPDVEIFEMALNLAQAKPEESIYLDDRSLFVEIAASLGMHAIQHRSLNETRSQLNSLGLL